MAEELVAGPFALFDGSFILEFLRPDASRNATVLMRTTYKHDHPLSKLGKAHPQAPPLHIHFDQFEAFEVVRGKVGQTLDWSATDHTFTRDDGVQQIAPWRPHTFWPCPDSDEDCVMLLWAYPDEVPEPMDALWFRTLLMYLSDVHEKKASLDVFQVMLMQHVTASTIVMLPTWTILGPLRWWVPWKLQSILAFVAQLMGKTPLMQKYVPADDWERLQKKTI